MCVYMYVCNVYMYVFMHVYIYIYIYVNMYVRIRIWFTGRPWSLCCFLIVQKISRFVGRSGLSTFLLSNFGLAVMFHSLSAKRNKGYRYWYFIGLYFVGIDRHLVVTLCTPLFNDCRDLPTEPTGLLDIVKV
jgi:hypothetical protein